MNKEQKAAVVEELSTELKDAEAIFAIDYRGISVPQAAELRTGLREADTRFRVVKNRLTLLAADAAGTDGIKDHLKGPTALALVTGDVALAAKTISKLGDEWELLEFKGGIMDGAALDPDQFKAIAKLPGRDQLNAQFAGIVASPLTGLVRGLGSMVQGLALQLQAIADQGLVSGEPPAAGEAPAEDAAPDAETTGSDGAEGAEEAEAPAGADADAPAGEAEDASSGEEASGETGGGSEDASSDAGDPDPEPSDSPEEEPSEEQAPAGEEGGEQVPQTGEGDAQPSEAAEEAAGEDGGGDEAAGEQEETSGDTDEKKEDE